jgi:hypothetical protein
MNQLLQPEDFFSEVRIGDFIVIDQERFFVVDLELRPVVSTEEEKTKVHVYVANRSGMIHLRLAYWPKMEKAGEEYHEVKRHIVYAQKLTHPYASEEWEIEVQRLNPGSWLARRV